MKADLEAIERTMCYLNIEPAEVFEKAFARLTPREFIIAVGIRAGNPNKTIAATLGISESTVDFHIANMASNLGLQGRVEIALFFNFANPPSEYLQFSLATKIAAALLSKQQK